MRHELNTKLYKDWLASLKGVSLPGVGPFGPHLAKQLAVRALWTEWDYRENCEAIFWEMNRLAKIYNRLADECLKLHTAGPPPVNSKRMLGKGQTFAEQRQQLRIHASYDGRNV